MLLGLLYQSYVFAFKPYVNRFEEMTKNPRDVQLARLSKILDANRGSRFGREHGFAAMQKWSDFSRAVPVRNYEDFSEYIEASVNGEKSVLTREDPLMFATTSGTSGQPKLIPVTAQYLKEYRRASIVSCYNLYRRYPGIARGCSLGIISSAEEGRTPGGVPFGAISGAIHQNEPSIVKNVIAPMPYDILTLPDYETRYYAILRAALTMPLAMVLTPNPSTIDLLCRKLEVSGEALVKDLHDGTFKPPSGSLLSQFGDHRELTVKDSRRAASLGKLLEQGLFKPRHIWPELSLLTCWTRSSAAFYLSRFPDYFEDIPVADMTYCASEGRGSVYLPSGKQVLAIDSHYYEFIAEEDIDDDEPEIKLADQLEVGRNYYILFTTSAGLYRYNLQDVVRVTGFHNRTPVIEFQYRGGNVSSFTGEKVTELQVVDSMKGLAEECFGGGGFRYFSLVPRFSDRPFYELFMELEKEALEGGAYRQDSEAMADRFDLLLKERNIEYRSKRDSGRLGEVRVRELAPGAYEKIRRQVSEAGRADAQIKLSHLNPRSEVLALIEALVCVKQH